MYKIVLDCLFEYGVRTCVITGVHYDDAHNVDFISYMYYNDGNNNSMSRFAKYFTKSEVNKVKKYLANLVLNNRSKSHFLLNTIQLIKRR